ncbi:hypothetical protein [Ornithinimicrobium sp. Y1694]|uniref:hypothetical protein n=1 Tax=Ornithinimicrobium sp. Y1694 TaxID=3418590 RepID=UPI003CFB1C24
MRDEEFKDHPVWESVKAVARAAGELTDSEEAAADLGSRVRQLTVYMSRFGSGSPVPVFSNAMLDKAVAPLQQLQASLTQAAQAQPNQRPTHVQSAHTQADAILAIVATWPQPLNAVSRSRAAEEQYAGLSSLLDDAAANHRAEVAGLRDELESLRSDKKALAAKLDTLEASIKARTEEVSKVASDQTEHFTKAQTSRAADHDELLSTHREEWATFLTEHQSSAKGLLEEMEDIKAKTKGVAGDTTSTVLARSFGDYAQRDFFTGVAALVLGLALVVGTLVLLIIDIRGMAPSQSLSWSWSLLKLGLVSTAVGAAAVLFGVGRGFLNNSRRNKRTELELRSIGLFLEGLDEDGEQARDAKLQWLDRAFGHDPSAKDGSTHAPADPKGQ